MRVLALDVGERRIGVAISDAGGTIALTVGVIPRRSRRQTFADIQALVDAHQAERVVVGLPLRLDGTEGEAAAGARMFAERLREVVPLPVELQDERLSTAEAERVMIAGDVRRSRRRVARDAVAAAIFLQTYLDRQR